MPNNYKIQKNPLNCFPTYVMVGWEVGECRMPFIIHSLFFHPVFPLFLPRLFFPLSILVLLLFLLLLFCLRLPHIGDGNAHSLNARVQGIQPGVVVHNLGVQHCQLKAGKQNKINKYPIKLSWYGIKELRRRRPHAHCCPSPPAGR